MTQNVKVRSKNRLYQIWSDMKQRCENPNNDSFHRYGGRGIKILWTNYDQFVSDMGADYESGLSIDRKDNDGHYCKENCRWATRIEQARNTRRNRWIEFNGQKLTMAEWAERRGLSQVTLRERLLSGWTLENALMTPCGPYTFKP